MILKDVIYRLKALANPEKVLYKEQKFGVKSTNALGIYIKDLNVLAREIGKDESLAVQLFDSNIYEAKLLCSKIFRPKFLTNELAEKWLIHFTNWEICDSFSMGIIAKSPLAHSKILEWTQREKEFEKRAGFATMAAYCMADKKAANTIYINFFPLLMKASTDERLYVKKAVNWALRSIGKRNRDLNVAAIQLSKEIAQKENKTAQWIAKDALKELESKMLNVLDYPRNVYRPA
ncbi:MAG: DNA alkylation repair protein [Flavobacteriales bacterium]|nr:DNA alkylation repair protein [Flavobacteriales bacterium]